MEQVIWAKGLVKRYGDLTAVDGIDLEIRAQECFGLLGPNGAGKTSTLRMICCVSPLSAGELRVAGMDAMREGRRIKALLGVVPQENNLDPDLTVLQNLLVYARYFQIPAVLARGRALEGLELFQLLDRQRSPIFSLSSGMKRRLILARALINQPKIMVLDEPTTGLDPQARHLVWQKLRQLKERGVTMILSTHYMEEAAALCDRLVIMHHGRILAQGCPTELVAQHVGHEVLEVRLNGAEAQGVIQRVRELGLASEVVEDTLYIFGEDGDALKRELSLGDYGLAQRPANLEDVFLKLTGRGLQD